MKIFYIVAISFVCMFFSACAGKDMKKFGGNLAFNSDGGHPIGTAIGVAVGGTIHGIGHLVEMSEGKGQDEIDGPTHEIDENGFVKRIEPEQKEATLEVSADGEDYQAVNDLNVSFEKEKE